MYHRRNTRQAEKYLPNDPSSAIRRTGAKDCNRDASAGFAAAHGSATLVQSSCASGVKIETAMLLRRAWRERRALAAKRRNVSVSVIEQGIVVCEAPAAKQLKVSVFGIGSIHGNVDPLGNAVLAAKQISDLLCCERRDGIGVVRKNMLARLEWIVVE